MEKLKEIYDRKGKGKRRESQVGGEIERDGVEAHRLVSIHSRTKEKHGTSV